MTSCGSIVNKLSPSDAKVAFCSSCCAMSRPSRSIKLGWVRCIWPPCFWPQIYLTPNVFDPKCIGSQMYLTPSPTNQSQIFLTSNVLDRKYIYLSPNVFDFKCIWSLILTPRNNKNVGIQFENFFDVILPREEES